MRGTHCVRMRGPRLVGHAPLVRLKVHVNGRRVAPLWQRLVGPFYAWLHTAPRALYVTDIYCMSVTFQHTYIEA